MKIFFRTYLAPTLFVLIARLIAPLEWILAKLKDRLVYILTNKRDRVSGASRQGLANQGCPVIEITGSRVAKPRPHGLNAVRETRTARRGGFVLL